MDHSNITIPRLQVKEKMVVRFGQLLITLIGMIFRMHGDEHSNELWSNEPILHLLQTLKKEPAVGCK